MRWSGSALSSSSDEEGAILESRLFGIDEPDEGSEPGTREGDDLPVSMNTAHVQVFDEPTICNVWEDLEALPEAPSGSWVPPYSSVEGARGLFAMLPEPLQWWVQKCEGLADWERVWQSQESVLPELQRYAKKFRCGERRSAIAGLFGSLGLLKGKDADMFEHLLCKFHPNFGHIQFRVEQDVEIMRFVMAMGDCFYSLVDDGGFSDALFWGFVPKVKDPENFVSGGVHSKEARQAWAELPGVSAHVQHWIQNKVWFKKKEHIIDRSARNASAVIPGSKGFDEDKFAFLDGKIEELLKCSAIEELPEGVLPDVLTRLSLAPKPGGGKDPWRIIMDMRPENDRHYSKVVRMEHLAHFPSVFASELLLFSLDLKSAYFSVSVDERLARTMGFEWRGKYYKFKCLPFGFKLAPYVFVKIGRQVVKKWRDQGPGNWKSRFVEWTGEHSGHAGVPCMLYIDDSAGGHRDFGFSVWMRNAMMLELEQLGFSLSAKGSLLPFPQLEFLGMLAHLASPTPSWFLPERKAKVLVALAEDLVRSHAEGKQVLCRMAAKCVGKLVSASRAVPISKILFREINACIYASKQPDWGGYIDLSDGAITDLLWIVKCFMRWNGECSPIWLQSMVETVDCALVQDAGPRAIGFSVRGVEGITTVDAPMGLPTEGGKSTELAQAMQEVANRQLHSFESTSGTIELTDLEADMHHVHKELLGVLLAITSRRWELKDKRVCVLVDATTSVAYITNWGGPSMTCNRLVRKIWGLCATFNIRIVQVSHVAGSVMITSGVDALSRPFRFARGKEAGRDDWRLVASCFAQLQDLLGVVFTVDRMATRANKRCKQFCSNSSVDPECFGDSAFSVDWRVDRFGHPAINYCFPPFSLIQRVVEHVKECQTWVTIVIPWWPSQHWWVKLVAVCQGMWKFPKGTMPFETIQDGEWAAVEGPLSFEPIVCVLDARTHTQRYS